MKCVVSRGHTFHRSNISRKIKVRLFIATVESVLLYGSEAWTLTQALTKEIDGCYTRMLRMALDISWKEGKTNEELYRNLPPVSSKIQTRRMKLAGHCIRHKEEVANKLVFWKPEGKRTKGRPATNYIDKLLNDTGLNNTEELEMVIMERQAWSEYVTAAGRPDGRPK